MSNIADIVNKNIDELTTEDIETLLNLAKSIYSEIPEQYSYQNILKRLLAKIPDGMDKRVGSIIYDALAPCSGELANMYIEIQITKDQTYIKTAKGKNLDKIGENYSIPRLKASKSQRIAEFIDTNDNYINLSIGSRFSVPDSNATITYSIIKQIETGKAIIECEQTGTIGNEYVGALLPLFSIDNLKSATIIGTQQPAQDEEIDDDYSARMIAKLNNKGFAGNIQAYKDLVIEKIDGASEPKVYPVWNGGGTVKLSIIDTQFNAITPEFQAEIKDIIDPTEYEGMGVGLAPIDHRVTIDTPSELGIDVSATLELESGYTIGSVQSYIEEKIEEYLLSLRKEWVKKDTFYVYLAQIIVAILQVDGVLNATNVLINNDNEDIIITSTALEQFIPVLGEVILNEQS